MTPSRLREAAAPHAQVAEAIERLAAMDGVLSNVLAGLTAVIAKEALQNIDFRTRLNDVLANEFVMSTELAPRADPAASAVPRRAAAKAKPTGRRRAPGPWDPYDVYAKVGETGLRDRLGQLELEQLRDIIAEHGMNTDGLAMRWKKTDRAIGRIVERVVDRAAKGDAFRSA